MSKQTNPNSNMVLFDAKNKVKKYNDVDEIMFDFAETRIHGYHLRKTHMCEQLLREKVTLDQKVRFVLMIISKELVVSNRKKNELMQDLRKHRFPTAKQVSQGLLGVLASVVTLRCQPRLPKCFTDAEIWNQ